MIQLIDTARSADFAEEKGSLPDLLRGIQEGCDPDELREFVAVESDFYPQLSGHYRRQAGRWLEQHRNGTA
jgi:cell division FtsZ-interacting protein ZapD